MEKQAAAKAPVGAGMLTPAFVPEPPLEKYEFEFPHGGEGRKASPLAKKIASEKGLDLGTVKGCGPSGRVTSRDLDLAQPDQAVAFSRREVPTIAPGVYEEIPLSPMRKAVGQRLQQSKSFIPHFYISQDVDAEALFHAREQLKSGQPENHVQRFRHPSLRVGAAGASPCQ